jgi:hypothetical protein
MNPFRKKKVESKEEQDLRRDAEAQLRGVSKLTDEHHRMPARERCHGGDRHRFMELGDGYQCPKCGGWLQQ